MQHQSWQQLELKSHRVASSQDSSLQSPWNHLWGLFWRKAVSVPHQIIPNTNLTWMKEAWECRAHFCCHAQGREHNGKKAPVSHTGLVQAVRQTSPQLVSSLQGQVTLSQIFFRKCGWLKQACTSSELHSPVKVIDLEVRAQQNRFSTSGPVTAGYS